jgi:hypothetical protein
VFICYFLIARVDCSDQICFCLLLSVSISKGFNFIGFKTLRFSIRNMMQALLSDVIVLPDRLLLKQAHVEKDVVESGIPMWS